MFWYKGAEMKKKVISLVMLAVVFLFGGVFLSKTPIEESKADGNATLSIYACNLSFKDNVYILYAVENQNVTDLSAVKLLTWTEGRQEYLFGTQDYELSYVRQETINGKNCVVYENSRLSAKQMTDTVYARAYYNDNGNAVYSQVVKYSIVQYAYNKLNSPATAEKLKTMLTSMLAYGSSAQQYYEYHLERLADATYNKIDLVNGTFNDNCTRSLSRSG